MGKKRGRERYACSGRGRAPDFVFAAYGPHIPVVCMSYNFWLLTGDNMMYQL